MKTTFLTKDIGVLSYKTSTYQEETIEFPADSIANWYPFDLNYTYRYSTPHKRFFLVLLELEAEEKRYQIYTNKDRAASTIGMFKPDHWYCSEVRVENDKVIDYAMSLGLQTIREDLTYPQVCANMRALGDREQDLLRELEHNVFERLKNQQDYDKLLTSYLRMDTEDKSSFILSRTTDEEREQLRTFGQMYNMYAIMKKRARAKA